MNKNERTSRIGWIVSAALGAHGLAAPSSAQVRAAVRLQAESLSLPALQIGGLTGLSLPAAIPIGTPAPLAPLAIQPLSAPLSLAPVSAAPARANERTAARRAEELSLALPTLAEGLERRPAGSAHRSGREIEDLMTGAPVRRGSSVEVGEFSGLAANEPSATSPDESLTAEVKARGAFVEQFRSRFSGTIVGQEEMRDSILLALLTGGHILLEGLPGVAKTKAVRVVSDMTSLSFRRIQFTRDLQPFDIMGQEERSPGKKTWTIRKGPIHHNLVLADEVNRAKAQTQSAMLEAMEEGQVTVAGKTMALPQPFMVLATQNPIEQDGVYPLPEAQLDRFMFKVVVPLPEGGQIPGILDMNLGGAKAGGKALITAKELSKLKGLVEKIVLSSEIKNYIARLYEATQPGKAPDAVKPKIRAGISPRGAIVLAKAAKAQAFLNGRSYVIPEDVKQVAHRVMRHRILLTFEAEGRLSTDAVVDEILKAVPVTVPASK